MNTLSRDLRKELERAVIAARRAATGGARKAVMALAVHEARPYGGMSEAQKKIRNRLRAHSRQLGDVLDAKKETQEIEHLIAECAYEHWHRMLFARFLAENDLLIHPEYGAPISLEECRGLARARGMGWVELAAEYAERMLPQIFRRGDPVLEVVLPPEARHELEELLEALPREVFMADDSLGWTYQFWQTERKAAVDAGLRSGGKAGADELPAKTQLFTEDYMVLFLLHNTLGAWWATKSCPQGVVASSEDEARAACALPDVDLTYLRFSQDEQSGHWRPAAGGFETWPRAARDVTLLDPCMGSGHFLVFALPILAAIRVVEEGLSHEDAVYAVLRENLYGLELDPRCTQIAAFNLGLAAWKRVGYRPLPSLNLACSGLGIHAKESAWVALAGDDEHLAASMRDLYRLFKDAPSLGSLTDPSHIGGSFFASTLEAALPLLDRALSAELSNPDDAELAVTAKGLLHAAHVLAGSFTLLATNVPYLKSGYQDDVLRSYAERFHEDAKGNLACTFVDRCLNLCAKGGTSAVVVINELLFLGTYRRMRERLLTSAQWNAVARLGPGAFGEVGGEVVSVSLVVLSRTPPSERDSIATLDAFAEEDPVAKEALLRGQPVTKLRQLEQLANPDTRVVFSARTGTALLATVADYGKGSTTGDSPHYHRKFWEFPVVPDRAVPWLDSPTDDSPWSGRHLIAIRPLNDPGLLEERGCRIHGQNVWGRRGVAVNKMTGLRAYLYAGEVFDDNVGIICPSDETLIPAILAYCESGSYVQEIRHIDQALKVTAATLVKVPFDVERWRRVAQDRYPRGLPSPDSAEADQWLFSGDPAQASRPLQVATARLVGYRWPRQAGSEFPNSFSLGSDGLDGHADDDGIVCVAPVRGEGSAAERLRALLADAFGDEWSAAKYEVLLAQIGYGGRTLEEWLRDGFFGQHCETFHNTPFVWHVWDGRGDGFNALVNYHRLAAPKGQGRKLLEKLTHTYLGDWIARQRADQKVGVPGADARLAAAQHLQRELEKIIDGEPPYDIFVRWKPLKEQPIGWEPDLNDGVRINIRPFMMAKTLGARGKKSCILRVTPAGIHWGRDRGTEPKRPKDDFPWFWSWDGKTQDFEGGCEFDGARWNDLHYTRAFKQAARERHAKAKSR